MSWIGIFSRKIISTAREMGDIKHRINEGRVEIQIITGTELDLEKYINL